MQLDAFIEQLLRLLGRGLAVDRTVLGLPVVHLARFLGELAADVLGVFGEVVAQFLEFGAEFALLRRHHCDRSLAFGRRGCLRRRNGLRRRHIHALPGAAAERRRHESLLDFDRAAGRTTHQTALCLLVIVCGVLKPDLEVVLLLADQRIADHAGPRTARRCVGSAIGSTISKRRPCWSEGTRARAAAISAGSISAITTPGSVPPSATIRPHGSTTSEW